jgi:hypothetical protein
MSRSLPGARRVGLGAEPAGRRTPGEGWLTAGVFVVAFLFQLPIRDRWLALLDEGYIMAIADDVNRGQVLYRDVTIDAPFPLAFDLLAAWFRLTETSIASSRWLATIAFAAYATGLFRVTRELLPRTWAIGVLGLVLCYRVWAFPHWQIYSYSMVAATLAVLAAALVGRAIRTGAAAWLALAGVAAGGAIMAKQDYGGTVALALTIALVVLPWLRRARGAEGLASLRPALTFMVGGAAVVLPYLGALGWQGALDEMVQQTLVFPFSVMSSFEYPRLPDLWPLFGQDEELRAGIGNYFPSILATLWWNDCPGCWAGGLGRGALYRTTAFWDVTLKLVFWAPILFTCIAAVAWTATALRERGRGGISDETRGRVLVLALAAGFLLAFNRPRDWVHLMMVYPPSLIVGAALAQQATRRLPAAIGRPVRAALVAGVAALLVTTMALMSDLRRRVDHWVASPRAGVYADSLNGPLIDDVLAWAARAVPAGMPLPVYPTQPALTFLAGRETVAGYYVIWPMQAGDRDRRIVEELDRRGVEWILFSVSQWAHLRSFQENAPALFDSLVQDWEIGEVFTREANGPILAALKRRAPAAPRTELRELASGSPSPARNEADSPGGPHWTRWPFTEVLTQPVAPPDAPAPLHIEVTVPRDRPILETAIGMNPDRWLGAPIGPLDFRVAVQSGDDTAQTVFARAIDPRGDVRMRRWLPVVLDLSRYAGEPITLVLSIEGSGAQSEAGDLAGWAAPAFVAGSAALPLRSTR